MNTDLHVYVSSTSIDLKEHRAAVIAALRKMGITPVCMEDYPAEDILSTDKCVADVAKSEAYVGIFAWRYGSTLPGYDKSITELEYRKALEVGIPTLIFLLDENADWPEEFRDAGQDKKHIDALREEFKLHKVVGWFNDPYHLASEVQAAVSKVLIQKVIAERYAEISVASTPDQSESVRQAMILLQQAMRQQSVSQKQASREPIPIQLPKLKGVFVDREAQLDTLYQCLMAEDKHLVVIVAPGGYGKTELTTKVLKEIAPSSDIVKKDVQGILYLRCVKGDINLGQIFTEAGRIAGKRDEFRDVYASKDIGLARKLAYFFGELSKAGNIWVVFDNFEVLLDPVDDSIRDEELREFLETATSIEHTIRIIVTSRSIPHFRGSRKMEKIDLSTGLSEEQAIRYLREEGSEYGLAEEDENVLRAFVKRVHCIPMALASVLGYLEDHYRGGIKLSDIVTDNTLFADFDRHDLEEGLKHLIFEQYKNLSPDAQLVISALSIFPKPVPQTVIRYLLPGISSTELAALITRLEKNRLIIWNNERYDLHPVVQSLVYEQIPIENLNKEAENDAGISRFTRDELHKRAAEFYGKVRVPREAGWFGIESLEYHLDQIYHLLKAERYNEACQVLNGIDTQGLHRFGCYQTIISLRNQLLTSIPSEHLRGMNMHNLARAYRAIGDAKTAIPLFEQALMIARSRKDLLSERASLGGLGSAYLIMGGENVERAQRYYEEALVVARKIGKPAPLATSYADLSNMLYSKGDPKQALNYSTKALDISRNQMKDNGPISANLGRVGNAYFAMGELDKALPYYENALDLARKAGILPNISYNLGNLARYYNVIGKPLEGLDYSRQALEISQRIGSKRIEAINLNNMANCYASLGEYGQAVQLVREALDLAHGIFEREEAINLAHLGSFLLAFGRVEDARVSCQKALEMNRMSQDKRGEGISLNILGRICIASDDIDSSMRYFNEALMFLQAVGDDRWRGITLCHFGIARFIFGKHEQAVELLKKAFDLATRIGDRNTRSRSCLYLGKCHAHLSEWFRAAELYSEAIQLEQTNTKYDALNALGLANIALGNPSKAEEFFNGSSKLCRELLCKTPNLWEPLQQLAFSLLVRGEAMAARETYAKALDVSSSKGIIRAALMDLNLLERTVPSISGIQEVNELLKNVME